MPSKPLTLQEEVLLVGLNDTTGKIHRGFNWLYPLNAAALAELVLRQRITVNADQIVVSNAKPVGDDVLDVALCRLAMETKSGKLESLIQALYRDIKLPFEVLTMRLVHRGILGIEVARVLWVFKQRVCPTRNPVPEQKVNQRIRDAIQRGTGAVPERTAILIALLNACAALRLVLPAPELKLHKRRIEEICASTATGEAVGKAMGKVIADALAKVIADQEAARQAMMTAAILAAAASSD